MGTTAVGLDHLSRPELLAHYGLQLDADDFTFVGRWLTPPFAPRRSLVDRGTPVLPVTAAWGELGLGFEQPVCRFGWRRPS